MKKRLLKTDSTESGFSLIEIIVVLVIIAVLSAISLPYIFNFTKLYKSEDQALKVIDLMRETSQLAIARRRTIRFELDRTDNAALIIDENNAGADTLIKSIPLEDRGEIRYDRKPVGVPRPNPPNYPDTGFASDTVGHVAGGTTVSGNSVWVARFRSDGSVVNRNDLPLSASIYSWPPITPGSTTPRSKPEVRAITLFGGSGAIRYWKYDGTKWVAKQ